MSEPAREPSWVEDIKPWLVPSAIVSTIVPIIELVAPPWRPAAICVVLWLACLYVYLRQRAPLIEGGRRRRVYSDTARLVALLGLVGIPVLLLGGVFAHSGVALVPMPTWTPQPNYTAVPAIPLVQSGERFDFEGSDDGWSVVRLSKDEPGGGRTYNDNIGFPGTIRAQLSSDYALSGHSSLRLSIVATEAGNYGAYVRRTGAVSGQGIVLYVFVPEIPDSCSISYVQLCVPSHNWTCSGARQLVPGEWMPLVIDLAGTADGDDVANDILTELAVQCFFQASSTTSFDLYLDAGEVLSPR